MRSRTGRRALLMVLFATAFARAAAAIALEIGDLVVTDQDTDAVLRIDPVSGVATRIAQGGLITDATGVAVADDGMVYVVDSSGSILRVDPDAFVPASPGANQQLVSQGGLLTSPENATVDADGTLLVAVAVGSRLVRVDPDAFNAQGPDANQTLVTQGNLLSAPQDVAVDRATGVAYVTSNTNLRVVRVAPGGTQSVVAQSGFLASPTGIARERDGHLLVAGENEAIVRIDPDAYSAATPAANQTRVAFGGELTLITDLALETSGELVVTNLFFATQVVRVDPDAYDAGDPDANQTIVAPGGALLTTPLAIAVYTPEPSASLLAATALAALVLERHHRKRRSTTQGTLQ